MRPFPPPASASLSVAPLSAAAIVVSPHPTPRLFPPPTCPKFPLFRPPPTSVSSAGTATRPPLFCEKSWRAARDTPPLAAPRRIHLSQTLPRCPAGAPSSTGNPHMPSQGAAKHRISRSANTGSPGIRRRCAPCDALPTKTQEDSGGARGVWVEVKRRTSPSRFIRRGAAEQHSLRSQASESRAAGLRPTTTALPLPS